MKPITTLAIPFIAALAPSCASPIVTSIADPAVPSHAGQAAAPSKAPATSDTIRARRIEIVDASDRPRITIGDRGMGTENIQFLNSEGEVVWSASYVEKGKSRAGPLRVGDAFVVHSEVDSGSNYNLMIGADGGAFYLGGEADKDEGAIGIQYSKGEVFLTLAATQETGGEASTAQVKIALVKNRIVIRDMSGKELIAFAAPLYDDDEK